MLAPLVQPASKLDGPSECPQCGRSLPLVAGITKPRAISIASLIANRKIEAIKEVRAATGWGLKEAKDYIDCPHATSAGQASAPPPPPCSDGGSVFCPLCGKPFPPGVDSLKLAEIANHVRAKNPINAIKVLREATGWGLKESKDFVMCPHR